MDNQLMLVIGNFEISWFAVFTTIACYIGMFIACILRRLQKKRVSDIYVCITFGVPLGLFFGRLVYILFSGNVLSGFLQYMDLTNGGFGLYGVMFGVFLATVLAAKLYDVDNFGQLLDCLSVGGAFAITMSRFATVFTPAEIGYEVNFKPFAVYDSEQGIYNLAVYKLDGIYEAIIFLLCLWFFIFSIKKCDRNRISGKTSMLMLALHGTNQVVMESMRADPLKLGLNEFIKISQIIGIVCCVAILVAFITITAKRSGFGKFHLIALAVIVIAIILGVFGEYRVGSSNYISNHLIMFSGMVLLDWLSLEFALRSVEISPSEASSSKEPSKEPVNDFTVETVAESSGYLPEKKQVSVQTIAPEINNNTNGSRRRFNSVAKSSRSDNQTTENNDTNMDSLMSELDNIKIK